MNKHDAHKMSKLSLFVLWVNEDWPMLTARNPVSNKFGHWPDQSIAMVPPSTWQIVDIYA